MAEIFTEIADLLESQGENPYKIRAYRNAVHTVELLSEPISAIAERGELGALPGFGERMVSVTEEILRTGSSTLYEQLKANEMALQQHAVSDEENTFDEERQEDETDIPSPW